jgi:hypothetical protein
MSRRTEVVVIILFGVGFGLRPMFLSQTRFKQGCRNRLRDCRRHCCGEGIRLTRGRCQEPFSKRWNFLRSCNATLERKINAFVGSI